MKFLKKAYPLNSYFTNKLPLTALHGLFVCIFLVLFQPFNLDVFHQYIYGYGLMMGFLTFVIPYLFFLALEKMNFQKILPVTLLLLFAIFLLIYSFVLWYFSGIYKDNFDLIRLSFSLFFKYSSFLALFSLLFFLVVNDKLKRFKKKKAVIINNKQTVLFYSENKKESIQINVDQLIYITISGNYSSFFVIKDNGIKEIVLRNTLSNILIPLKEYPKIFKCHKSYIVNTKYINAISGNARGYFLISDKLSHKIPVSRSYKKKDLENLIKK